MAVEQRFFIIGAQRSGTTLLHDVLALHPDIAVNEPVHPEPKHFLRPGSEHTIPGDYDRRYYRDISSPVRGEKGTTYLEFPASGRRMSAVFPSALFLVMVRDPVERAISNYAFTASHGLEPLSAEEALTERAEIRGWRHLGLSSSPYYYVRRGLYARYLKAWAEAVGRDRILVVRLEDIGTDLPVVQRFIGVRPHPAVGVSRRVNASSLELEPAELQRVRGHLADYYREPNHRLASSWGIRIDDWGVDA